MERLHVATESKSYDIVFKASFNDLLEEILGLDKDFSKIAIISDQQVGKLYQDEIKHQIEPHFNEVFTYSFVPGEFQKHLGTVSEFYHFMIENKLDRKSLLIALGGGVTGDMVGFAAATFMRGISFVQIPTSLLAQVDSSIGGKTAVDFNGYKNLVGAFYQPELVYINTATLKTLSKKEFISGMGEVIKHGIIADPNYLKFIQENHQAIVALDHEILSKMIRESCAIKCSVVSKDERENGIREILNFGHTAGHAIEKLKNFELLHGECVGIGMVIALTISHNLGTISKEEYEFCIKIIVAYDMPVTISGLCAEEIYQEMFSDKKTSHNQITYVLVNPLGHAIVKKQLDKELIMAAIEAVIVEE